MAAETHEPIATITEQQFSVALSWPHIPDAPTDLDLYCILVDSEGHFLNSVFPGRGMPSMVEHSGDVRLGHWEDHTRAGYHGLEIITVHTNRLMEQVAGIYFFGMTVDGDGDKRHTHALNTQTAPSQVRIGQGTNLHADALAVYSMDMTSDPLYFGAVKKDDKWEVYAIMASVTASAPSTARYFFKTQNKRGMGNPSGIRKTDKSYPFLAEGRELPVSTYDLNYNDAGKAAPDLRKILYVSVERAQNLSKIGEDQPKPFVEIKIRHSESGKVDKGNKTGTNGNGEYPDWRETFKLKGLAVGDTLVFEVYHKTFLSSTLMGHVELAVARTTVFGPRILPLTGPGVKGAPAQGFLQLQFGWSGEDGDDACLGRKIARDPESWPRGRMDPLEQQ